MSYVARSTWRRSRGGAAARRPGRRAAAATDQHGEDDAATWSPFRGGSVGCRRHGSERLGCAACPTSPLACARWRRCPGVPEATARRARGVHRGCAGTRRCAGGSPRPPRSRGCAGPGRAPPSTGAQVPVDLVRDLMRGRRGWPSEPDPVEQVAARRGAGDRGDRARARPGADRPAAGAGPAAHGRGGRAAAAGRRSAGRGRAGEQCPGARRPRAGAGRRRGGRRAWPARRGWCSRRRGLPALVVAPLVHAEIAAVRPFVRGNAVVARAMERAVVQASGLDPTGVAVPRSGTAGRAARPTWARSRPTRPVRRRGWRCGSRTARRRSWPARWRGAASRRGAGRPAGLSEPASGGRVRRADVPRSAQDVRKVKTSVWRRRGVHMEQADGREPDDHREAHRGPTRGQSTGGPIVMGLSQCDNKRIHAWYPGRLTVGWHPVRGVPSICGGCHPSL